MQALQTSLPRCLGAGRRAAAASKQLRRGGRRLLHTTRAVAQDECMRRQACGGELAAAAAPACLPGPLLQALLRTHSSALRPALPCRSISDNGQCSILVVTGTQLVQEVRRRYGGGCARAGRALQAARCACQASQTSVALSP